MAYACSFTGACGGAFHPADNAANGRYFRRHQTSRRGTRFRKVSQKGAKFRPALLVVCVKTTVDFLNDEDRPIEHNVFSNSPVMQFDLGLYKPGESRPVTFDKPGAVLLYCSIHRHMDGVVYVTPTPYFAVIDGASGDLKYKIDDVPAGRWIVRTWQHRKRFPEAEANVDVAAGGLCTQDLQLGMK
jgi:plastocyanin